MRISDWSSDVCSSDLILQEIALYALWRADFFDVALFQGGTSLRILHGLSRFSEDLDFLLRAPDPEFDWTPYLNALTDVGGQFGLKQIGRESCREKAVRYGENSVVAVSLKKKQ